MKTFLRLMKITLLIAIIIMFLEFIFNPNITFKDLMSFEYFGIYLFYSGVLTTLNAGYFIWLNKNVKWEGNMLANILKGMGGSIVLTLGGFLFCRFVHLVIFTNTISAEDFLKNERINSYFFPLLFTTIVTLLFYVFYFYKQLNEKRVQEQKIIAGTASAKFESLKNQIDPHFLFNSLNVLTSLIEENPGKAQKFTTSLSKIYRYVLEQKDKELVSVLEELEFADTYMKLLKMRFENSIYYEHPNHISDPEAKVVPLSLQLLLENTVKHNIVSESKPLYIRIYEEDGYLVVENDFQKKEVLSSHKGVGLQNIVDRYSLITERVVYIENTEKIFRIKLPILTQQISIMETYRTNQDVYYKAQKRVKEMKDFYGSVISYCVVIPFLIFINHKTFWGFQWFWFPLIAWGISLIVKGFNLFGYGADWEERKIREFMEKDVEQKNTWK